MDDIKRTSRDVTTETRKRLRDADGHDLGDDLGNAGDEIRKDLGNAGDTLRRGLDDGRDSLRHAERDERVVRNPR